MASPLSACPICQGAERELLYGALDDRVFGLVDGRWSMQRCYGCRCAYLDPPPSAGVLQDAYESYYTHVTPAVESAPVGVLPIARRALRNGLINACYGYRLTPATRLAPLLLAGAPGVRGQAERAFRHLRKGERLLDVGCGSGGFVAHADSVGWQATGIDVDERAVAAGRAAGYDLRVETLDQHDGGGYDAITLSHVIEHVADPVALLQAAREHLAPGGVLWLSTPNLGSIGHQRFARHWFAFDVPRHLVLFDHGSLQLALTRAGFGPLRDAPHTPAAAAYFAASEAMQRGDLAIDGGAPSVSTRWRGMWADRAARRDPRLGEELVVLAGAQ